MAAGEEFAGCGSCAWHDSTLDVAALVTAVRTGDTEGVRAVLAHCHHRRCLAIAVKALAEVAERDGQEPGEFSRWLEQAAGE